MSETRTKRRDWKALRKAWAKELIGLAVVLGLAVTARATFADHYHVPSGSMRPTVEIGDRIFVNKAAYGLRLPLSERWLAEFDGPEPGEVVVLHSPETGEVLLKRVVAGPGDRVAFRAGRLWLNGRFVPVEPGSEGQLVELLGEHEHPLLLTRGGGPDLPPVVVPPDSYLVVGDNRGDSLDGRSFGWVERRAILGRGVAIFAREGWPTWKSL